MSEQESDEDYQARMDRLAIKVGRALDGQSFLDSATVAAGLAAFAIVGSSPSIAQRERLLEQIVEFMRRQIRKNPEDFSEH